ncbi:MAG: glycosyl transferase family 2 [Chloroflexi bacterium]|nr:glycosyl transferase family 2 [Chloroflexota bacterium]
MTDPVVTVVIVSFNTRELLRRCLECLESARFTVWFETVVVDNASRDGSPEMVHALFPRVRLIESSRNLGFAAANNLALRQACGQYALLLNSDTEIAPGLLDTMVAWAERHPNAGAVGCKLVNGDGSLQRSCWRFPTPVRAIAEAFGLTQLLHKYSNYREWDYGSERQVDFAIGACLLLRLDALRKVSFFDERYFLYAEEADLSRRLSEHGWQTWYTPACTVVHRGGASATATTSYQFLHAQDQFFQRWYGPAGVLALRLSQLIGPTIRLGWSRACALRQSSDSNRESWRARQATILQWSLNKSRLQPRHATPSEPGAGDSAETRAG